MLEEAGDRQTARCSRGNPVSDEQRIGRYSRVVLVWQHCNTVLTAMRQRGWSEARLGKATSSTCCSCEGGGSALPLSASRASTGALLHAAPHPHHSTLRTLLAVHPHCRCAASETQPWPLSRAPRYASRPRCDRPPPTACMAKCALCSQDQEAALLDYDEDEEADKGPEEAKDTKCVSGRRKLGQSAPAVTRRLPAPCHRHSATP